MIEENNRDFKLIVREIKNEIKKNQIKTMQEVNSNLIKLYFKLGKIVSEINIRSMRLFYEEYCDD